MNTTFKAPGKLSILTLVIISALSASAHSEEIAYHFSDHFIMGEHNKADLSHYTTTGIAEGVYSLDVYTNGEWKGRYDLTVNKQENGELGICYNKDMLKQYGISVEKFNKELSEKLSYCGSLQAWNDSETITDHFNKSDLRLDITVPQIYVDKMGKNYVDPSFWDKGITALNLGWSGNIWNSHYSSKGSSDTTTGYLGLDAGLTFKGWMLKHRGNLAWENKGMVKWDSTQTYLERPIPELNSNMKVGQVSTTGELFESITLRGVNIKTDTAMFPDGMNSFAPEIRGVAQTNALVTVKQGSSVIYQTTVPPGPFILDDVYPGGYGNDLEVTIKESDGSETLFTVAYNSGVNLLRPGVFKYEFAIGKPDNAYLKNKPVVYQGTVQYGLNNYLTAYTGVTGFNHYTSVMGGIGLNTNLGGFSGDITTSKLNDKFTDYSGERYRVSYNRKFDSTKTHLSLTASKYSSDGFHTLNDGLVVNDRSVPLYNKEKSSISLSVNQTLPENWGSVYFSGKQVKYFDGHRKENQYQVSYNNHIGNLNWTLSAQQVKTTNRQRDNTDNRVSLNMSYPLSFGDSKRVTLTSNTLFNDSKYTNTQIGASGSLDNENNVTYGIHTTLGDNKSFGLSGGYRNPMGNFNASFSQGQNYRSTSLGGNGSIIIHDEGVTFSPETGRTLALIKAKDAEGAHIGSSLGSRIDSNGFAVVSSLRPYKINSIELDPKGAPENVVINQTMKQVVPWEGRIVKVTFDTEVQDNLFIKGKLKDGSALPFGANVYNEKGDEIGLVGQGSVMYIKNASSSKAVIHLENGQCTFHIPTDQNKEVICQ